MMTVSAQSSQYFVYLIKNNIFVTENQIIPLERLRSHNDKVKLTELKKPNTKIYSFSETCLTLLIQGRHRLHTIHMVV